MLKKLITATICSLLLLFINFANLYATEFNIVDLGSLGATNIFGYGINNDGYIVGTADDQAFFYDGTMSLLDSSPYSSARAINDSGVIAGYSGTVGNLHAVTYNGSTINNIGTLGGTQSFAYDINNSGYVVGESDTATGEGHAFIYDGATLTDITPTWDYARAVGINDMGYVVGSGFQNFSLESFNKHGFIYDGLVTTRIDSFMSPGSSLSDINNNGIAVGSITIAVPTGSGSSIEYYPHAIIYEDSSITDIGTLGGNRSGARAINNNGQVVGGSDTSDPRGIWNAFIYEESTGMVNLNDFIPAESGVHFLEAYDINDNGEIVGVGLLNGDYRLILALPVPIPSSILLLFSGLVGIVGTRRFKKY